MAAQLRQHDELRRQLREAPRAAPGPAWPPAVAQLLQDREVAATAAAYALLGYRRSSARNLGFTPENASIP